MIEQNHECYVDLEVAKLLKEAGFNWECLLRYWADTGKTEWFGNSMIANPYGKDTIACPTLSVAQRWLREVKKLYIEVQVFSDSNINGVRFGANIENSSIATPELYNTYEEAQEAGIKKALEIILKK